MRNIDDQDYIECLTPMYQRHYYRWRERMLNQIETIVQALQVNSISDVMEGFQLSPRDIALLVRLRYFTPEEVEAFGLRQVEALVPQ